MYDVLPLEVILPQDNTYFRIFIYRFFSERVFSDTNVIAYMAMT